MANIVKLGSLLLDGAPVKPGSKYQPGQTISLGDGDDLQWVIVNSMLIADRPLLTHISWNDLHQQKLVFRKQVAINGQQFLCRLLRVGAEEDVPNEWDAALGAVGDDNETWHWEKLFFWGQETLDKYESPCAVRGYFSARNYSWRTSSNRGAYYGFRPALVPMPSDHLIPGSKVCAIGGQSVLYGTLSEVTDYDIIIQPEPFSMLADTDAGKLYSKLPDGTVIIERSYMAVQTIKKD